MNNLLITAAIVLAIAGVIIAYFLSVTGKESIAIATGIDGKAKGSLGCYIGVAEWKKDENGNYHLTDFQARKVDGINIKSDTFYMLKDGEFKECI